MSSHDARARILASATELFYRHGINNVGVDQVIEAAGVAKMSLYRHFGSKDELVLAFLERTSTDWMSWLRERVARAPVEVRPLAVFDALEEWFRTEEFRGCPFIGTAAEFRDPSHPAHRAAWAFKQGLRDYFAALIAEAGARDPDMADQLLLLADGAIVRAAMEGRPDAARSARAAASSLLAGRLQAGRV